MKKIFYGIIKAPEIKTLEIKNTLTHYVLVQAEPYNWYYLYTNIADAIDDTNCLGTVIENFARTTDGYQLGKITSLVKVNLAPNEETLKKFFKQIYGDLMDFELEDMTHEQIYYWGTQVLEHYKMTNLK